MMAAQSVESHLKKLAREGRVRETVVPDKPSLWNLEGGLRPPSDGRERA